MYLEEKERVAAGEFIAGGLWRSMKRALLLREPPHSEAGESTETASQRAFERKGYERCLDDIKRISVEAPPEGTSVIPATLQDERD